MPTTPNYKNQNSVVDLFRPMGLTLYSLRRSYARLMEDALIPRTRRRAYAKLCCRIQKSSPTECARFHNSLQDSVVDVLQHVALSNPLAQACRLPVSGALSILAPWTCRT